MADKSGIPIKTIQAIENHAPIDIGYSDIFQITDCLQVGAEECAYLLRLVKSTRQFQIYNVGLMRTGTHFMQRVFKNYRSQHEAEANDTLSVILKFRRGIISESVLKRFLRDRDTRLLLEMDSAYFLGDLIEFYVTEFPNAKFILTIRDCFTWVNSFYNMCFYRLSLKTRHYQEYMWKVAGIPLAVKNGSYEDGLKGLRLNLAELFWYWSSRNQKIIDAVPPERLLILRTDALSKSLKEISMFANIPEDSLYLEKPQDETPPDRKQAFLGALEETFVQKLADERCGDLMRSFFPEVSFKQLQNQFGTV